MPTTTFVWDPVNDCVISELDGTGTTQAVYTNEPQQYGGVLSQRRGSTSRFLHADALGTTRLLTSTAGATTDTYLFDAWGVPVASTGTTLNPFKWVGRYGYYTDNATGLIYVRARMYAPTIARWSGQIMFLHSNSWIPYIVSNIRLFPLLTVPALNNNALTKNHIVEFSILDAQLLFVQLPRARKPITFGACCSYSRLCALHYDVLCTDFWTDGWRIETEGPMTVPCTLAAGISVNKENLGKATFDCCTKSKPGGNWWPGKWCWGWTTKSTTGGCGKPGGGEETHIEPSFACEGEQAIFFELLDLLINGNPPGQHPLKALPDAGAVANQCRVLCECWFGTNTFAAGFCMRDSFCVPVMDAAGYPGQQY
ncbi:MAG: hypothetical protein JNL58_31545 [Planctomyces sp.]|nr:hypothetical protein [Planctomyces sp.]